MTNLVQEKTCPNGHGPMMFYESEPGDDRGDFYECPDCGYSEDADAES